MNPLKWLVDIVEAYCSFVDLLIDLLWLIGWVLWHALGSVVVVVFFPFSSRD